MPDRRVDFADNGPLLIGGDCRNDVVDPCDINGDPAKRSVARGALFAVDRRVEILVGHTVKAVTDSEHALANGRHVKGKHHDHDQQAKDAEADLPAERVVAELLRRDDALGGNPVTLADEHGDDIGNAQLVHKSNMLADVRLTIERRGVPAVLVPAHADHRAKAQKRGIAYR